MYKYLESNESFKDLKSDSAKINYNIVMRCLESASCPNIAYSPYYPLTTKVLNKDGFERNLNYLCDRIFLDKNNNMLSKELVRERINFDLQGYPYGFTRYDISKGKFIDIEGGKYLVSSIIAIHELTHAILFLHKATIPKQYEELLSIFNEIRACSEMSQEIQDEWLFNKIAQRLSRRVHIEDLSDEALQNHQISNDNYFEDYFRMLNFVYALRLYELYTLSPEQVYQDVNNILINKNNILDLLRKYNISLENVDTISAFERKIAEFENIINRYFKNEIECRSSF